MTSMQVKQGWKEMKLSDLADVTSSKRIYYSEYVESGVPFYRSREIIETYNNKEITLDLFISEEKYDEIKEKFGVPQGGDILITSVGTLGIPYQVKSNDKFYFKDGNLIWLRNLVDEFVMSDFLYYWITDEHTQSRLKNVSIGSSQKAFTISAIKEVTVQLPPLKTQQKIASILSAFDDLIENNTKRIKILENTAQLIYKEWFVDFKFPGHEKVRMVPVKTETIHELSLREIPEGWEVKRVGDLVTIRKGKNITKKTIVDGIVPVVAGGLTPAYYHNVGNIQEPVVTISASGANSGYINMYHESIWASDCSYIDKTVTENVYFYYLFLKINQEQVTGLQRGSAQPHVYPKDLMLLEITAPPSSIIQQFSNLIESVFLELKFLQRKNEKLQKTRDLLLPKLLSGEIEVDNLTIKQ